MDTETTFSLRLRFSMESDASPISVKLLALSVDIILQIENQQFSAPVSIIYFCSISKRRAHRAGGMYFRDTPSCLPSTNVSYKINKQLLRGDGVQQVFIVTIAGFTELYSELKAVFCSTDLRRCLPLGAVRLLARGHRDQRS